VTEQPIFGILIYDKEAENIVKKLKEKYETIARMADEILNLKKAKKILRKS
jgi:hypothetical protein